MRSKEVAPIVVLVFMGRAEVRLCVVNQVSRSVRRVLSVLRSVESPVMIKGVDSWLKTRLCKQAEIAGIGLCINFSIIPLYD